MAVQMVATALPRPPWGFIKGVKDPSQDHFRSWTGSFLVLTPWPSCCSVFSRLPRRHSLSEHWIHGAKRDVCGEGT